MADDFQANKAAMLETLNELYIGAVPHNGVVGMRLVDVEPEAATMALPWSAEHVGNPETGVLHGGIVTTLIDSTCGIAVFIRLQKFVRIATLDLRIDYLKPARPNEELFARAECYKLTRQVAFVRALAFQSQAPGDVIASAQGTFIIAEE